MRGRPLLALLVAAAAALTALSCSSSDGRTLPPADPDRTTTTPSAPVIQPPTGAVATLSLQSPTIAEDAVIPAQHTCAGADVSPALSWTGVPVEARSLAIVVRDTTAGGYVHWVVGDIDPFIQGFGEGGLPEGAVEGLNSKGTVGWTGPCPPAGSGTHNYEIALHALAEEVTVDPDAPANEMATLIEAVSSQRAVLTGTVAAPG